MAQKKKTPDIRFAGFTDDWETKKLGDVADVTKLAGFEFTEYVVYSDEGNIIALRGLNVKNGALVLDDVKYIDNSDFSKLNRSKLYANDVLFTYVGTVGELAIIPENTSYYLAPNVARIRFNDKIVPYFILQEMESERFYNQMIFPLIATSSQPALSMQNIRKFIILYPIDAEQKEIGKTLSNLDALISLQQRKVEKLQNIKKSMLEKMFPKAGSRVPELRFEGFKEPWETKKLGAVGSVAMCRRIYKHQTTDFGDIPFFKIGTFGGEPDAFISRELFEDYKAQYPYPERGDVLISASGSIGRTVVFTGEEEYFQDSNIVWLKHDNSILNSFLYYLYAVVKWAGIEGSTIKRLYSDNILKTTVYVPSLSEQDKIAKALQSLDSLITLQQQKLEKLQNIKKSMLEKMFV